MGSRGAEHAIVGCRVAPILDTRRIGGTLPISTLASVIPQPTVTRPDPIARRVSGRCSSVNG